VTDNQSFKYENLFASRVPGPQPFSDLVREKYDFAVAYPDPATLPLVEMADLLKDALREEGRDLAVYPNLQGYPPLREFLAQKLAKERGIEITPDEIMLADGSSQPLHMLTEALVDPGDVVFVEDFVYAGTLGTFNRFGADIRGVMCDDQGILPDSLESGIQEAIKSGKQPKIIYTIPTFQNPQGWTMTVDRRKELIRLSMKYGIPIMEDDCYVDLRYDGENVPSIHSLDDSGSVMYVGSFSKIIAPGIRLGYMTASPEVMDRIRPLKSGGGVSQFTSLAVHRYSTTKLDEHITAMGSVLRAKRDAMLAALGENFGSAASWSRPEGALYIWLRLPEGADFELMLPASLEAQVGYGPGPRFSPDGVSGKNYARLCFGYNTTEEIHEGISRLAEVCDKAGMLKG